MSPQGKRQLRKSRRRLEGNKKINLKELGCKSMVSSAWSAEAEETATTVRMQYARQRHTDRETHRQREWQSDSSILKQKA